MEPKTSTLSLRGRRLTLTHGDLRPGRGALLFLHGLGDSADAFAEAFSALGLEGYNVLAPDMPGYGHSAGAGRIGFADYATILEDLCRETQSGPVLLVGHSMGGAVGTLAASASLGGRARGLVNIEGNLTVADQFISRKALAAYEAGRFDAWFGIDFLEKTVAETWAPANEASRRYLASLRRCDPAAFLENCRELVRRSTPSPVHPLGEVAEVYLALGVPKLFCAGGKSCPAETLALLEDRHEQVRVFPEASHAVMIDGAEVFYAELSDMAHRLPI